MKNIKLLIIRASIIAFSIYCYYTPDMLTFDGYSLGINGVVLGRALFLIFTMFNIMEIFKELQEYSK